MTFNNRIMVLRMKVLKMQSGFLAKISRRNWKRSMLQDSKSSRAEDANDLRPKSFTIIIMVG